MRGQCPLGQLDVWSSGANQEQEGAKRGENLNQVLPQQERFLHQHPTEDQEIAGERVQESPDGDIPPVTNNKESHDQ